MAKTTRNFTAGKMNKMVDERLVPDGEYIDALNIRLGSSESSEIGVAENSKGNSKLTNLRFRGTSFTPTARTIGAFEDGARETIYWFIHDDSFVSSPTGKLDAIVSYNTNTQIVTYHIVSIDDGGGVNTTLNFNPLYLITGVDLVENLLFFTDNINPPRKINTTKNYADPDIGTDFDGFTYDDIMVIKRPPAKSPKIDLIQTSTQENFLSERFICFAYRYKYDDSEYSATSQWSDPAFTPQTFDFSSESYLNEGAQNLYNTAQITFNTGGPLVTGIDLLFKDSGNSVIKIIEKLTKDGQGYTDNQEVTYKFTNSKIFTILSEAEILRLYDNVPRLAKASTLMGNRLMYANYVEGYDLKDYNDSPVRFDYTTSSSKEDFDENTTDGVLENGTFTIQGTQTYDTGKVSFDLEGLNLVEGAQITFIVQFTHSEFGGDAPLPEDINPSVSLQFGFLLTQNFASVYEFIVSDDFTQLIGTDLPSGNIQPMATAADGTTMTDVYNNLFVSTIDGTFAKYESGISAIEQAISVISTPGSTAITMQFPAIQYNIAAPAQTVTEYFNISQPELVYSKLGSGKSLHSNRDYDIGIVYMDEFNRATPALVSQYNTEHFTCSDSDTANSILVNIPTTQIAPSWATRYKFAIKPDKETYETIYSTTFFTNSDDNLTYYLLSGENSQKVTEGQRLIVKRDSNGPTSSCIYATVLEKKAQAENWLGITAPSGVYMAIRATSFATTLSDNAFINPGQEDFYGEGRGDFAPAYYPVNIPGTDPDNPAWTHVDYTIPEGSIIKFDFKFGRTGQGSSCGEMRYTLVKTMTSTQDYDNFYDWFIGDNIENVLSQGVSEQEDECDITTVFLGIDFGAFPESFCEVYFGFDRNSTNNYLQFRAQGIVACGSNDRRRTHTRLKISVLRAEQTAIFESEPLDASPDIWYEGSQNFDIVNKTNICQFLLTVPSTETNNIAFDYTNLNGLSQQEIVSSDSTMTIVGECGSASINAQTPSADSTIVSTALSQGSHLGSVQNQVLSLTQPAIIDTGFFNCYAFGNGVESYKIRDSVLGLDLKLGNRVTSTEAQEYREIRRFADITYSGVFNDESNINKLNEFNGGLLNFKALEESFGDIQLIEGIQRNILVLQEDKISYVQQGVNLLSDAGAGNLLTTVPEVLGTQVTRAEEYGISHNPESFAKFGPHRYFTDAKRGVALQLSGAGTPADTLTPISQFGMRSWFRDLFQVSFETQKLGGFDPYMQEYVLTSNQELIPVIEECVPCGITQNLNIVNPNVFDTCFEMGSLVGDVTIDFTVVGPVDEYTATAIYGDVTRNFTGSSSHTFNINKDEINVTQIQVTITSTGTTNLDLSVSCPDSDSITLVNTCLTSPNEGGLLIHNQFRFVDGTFTSPLTSDLVQFEETGLNPIVSFYNSVTGQQGNSLIPTNGSTVTLTFNKFEDDTAIFDEDLNKFRFLRSSTNYPNTPVAVNSMINASTAMTTVVTGAPDVYTASFTMPTGNDNDYLYLIYDYRKPNPIRLCFGADTDDACCGCTS